MSMHLQQLLCTSSPIFFLLSVISLAVCWSKLFWIAPGGTVTSVRVKICSRQEICVLVVEILSLMLDWCCSASLYLAKDEPAVADVCWSEARTSSSWQASSRSVNNRKKMPKLMWSDRGHTWSKCSYQSRTIHVIISSVTCRSSGTNDFLITLLNFLAFFMFPPSSSKKTLQLRNT